MRLCFTEGFLARRAFQYESRILRFLSREVYDEVEGRKVRMRTGKWDVIVSFQLGK